MITPGLLDQRLTIYTQEQAGAYGFTRPVYVKQGTYWGRLDELSNTQRVAASPQSHVDNRLTARAMVDARISLPATGLVRVDTDGTLYHIRGVVPLRQLNCQRIELERLDPTAAVEFVGFESVTVADGMHLVTTQQFSTAFDEAFA